MIIYKTTDRIPVVMGEITVWISPLSHDQRTQLTTTTKMQSGKEVIDGLKLAFLAVKFAVKKVDGLTNMDGSPYELTFDTDGTITMECANELLSMDSSVELGFICARLVNGIETAKKEAAERGYTAEIKIEGTQVPKKKLGAV